ncbi:nuclease-related domain-containing protein [Embleya sp. NPDC001921]
MNSLAALAAAALVATWFWHRPSIGPGGSAATRARRLRTPLVRLADLIGVRTSGGRQAARWAAGAEGERRTAARLGPLLREGWTVLHDRALPTGRANIDHLVVSPGGVVIVVDSKRWSRRFPLRVVSGRLLHGDLDVTGRLDGIRHEASTVARVLGCPVIPLVSMDGPHIDGELRVAGVRIIPAERTAPALRALGGGRRARGGAHPGKAAARLFPPYRKD